MTAEKIRLEEIRKAIRAESVSYGELAELQGMAKFIDHTDAELLEWAGVPEANYTAGIVQDMPDPTIELCEDCIDAYQNGIEPGETACEARARGERV